MNQQHDERDKALRQNFSDIIEFPQLPKGRISTRDMRGQPFSSTELSYKLSLIMERVKAARQAAIDAAVAEARQAERKIYERELQNLRQFQEAVIKHEELKTDPSILVEINPKSHTYLTGNSAPTQ